MLDSTNAYNPVHAHNFIVKFIEHECQHGGNIMYTYSPETYSIRLYYKRDNKEVNTLLSQLIIEITTRFGEYIEIKNGTSLDYSTLNIRM